MQYRLMASYLGVPYHVALGPGGNEATLFSPGPPPDELGFVPAGGHWRKQVSLDDLGALWQYRVTGEYRGEPCLVLDDLGDRLHLAYLGRDSARARQLGYWEIDREVFEVVVSRQEVIGLTEERVEFGVAAGKFPAADAGPDGQPAAQGVTAPRVTQSATRVAAWHGSPEADPWPGGWPGADGAAPPREDPAPGRRTARRDRTSPQSLFAELLSLAAIPHTAYAVDEEVPGAMCLVKTDVGFEVFSCTEDSRLEVRFFEDEEGAYFYLFGVLAAEAVRSGRLRPETFNEHVNGSREAAPSAMSAENVSDCLRRRKLPK